MPEYSASMFVKTYFGVECAMEKDTAGIMASLSPNATLHACIKTSQVVLKGI